MEIWTLIRTDAKLVTMNDEYGSQANYVTVNAINAYNTWAASTNNATIAGQVMWNGKPVIDDDDGGSAPVREPRRPAPVAPAGSVALEPEVVFA